MAGASSPQSTAMLGPTQNRSGTIHPGGSDRTPHQRGPPSPTIGTEQTLVKSIGIERGGIVGLGEGRGEKNEGCQFISRNRKRPEALLAPGLLPLPALDSYQASIRAEATGLEPAISGLT